MKCNDEPIQASILPGLLQVLPAVGVQRASPSAGARGVLAPSSSPSRRRRHKGALESPDCDALVMAISATRLYTIDIKKKYICRERSTKH
jgi:hypothetical protein